jgi:hypothetical protein
VHGFTDIDNAAAMNGQAVKDAAELDAAGRAATTILPELGGRILGPGVYKSGATTFAITTGILTLDAGGDPNAVWIFQAESTGTSLNTGVGTQVVLAGGAVACNVFWQLAGTATLGGGSVFNGSIMASTSITVGTTATVNGRLLANTGDVTLATGDTVNGCACQGEPTPTPTPTP